MNFYLIKKKSFWLILTLFISNAIFCQITENDGDWSAKTVVLENTPQARLMARTGDIDNLNFGWPTNFDPFSGKNTPRHSYPWTINPEDPPGTDRILVISSYNNSPPCGRDGYTNSTSRPENSVIPITVNFPTSGIEINSATLQIFADDFQAPVWCASYEVTIDEVRVPFLESVINSLSQTGPIGRICSVVIPDDYLYLLEDGELSIKFDDSTTGAGDGYAIDFIKLLINPVPTGQYATIKGTITDAESNNPVSGVQVVANGLIDTLTDSNGLYVLDKVNPGLITVKTYKNGYGSQTKTITLAEGQTGTLNFQLRYPAPEVISVTPTDGEIVTDLNSVVEVIFNQDMNTSTFNSSNFILSDETSSVSGTFSTSDTGFVFTPDVPLRKMMNFTATLTTGIKNANDITLDKDYIWYFSTSPQDLQDTIDIAQDGDTIIITNYIHQGRGDEYIDNTCGNCEEENADIHTTKGLIISGKKLVLIGQSRENSIIQTNGGYGIILEDADGTVLKDFAITGGIRTADGKATDAGIVIRNSTNVTIDNVYIHDNNASSYPGIAGIALREGAEVTIENCLIEKNSWDGIALYMGGTYGPPPSALIQFNELDGGRIGDNCGYGSGIGTTWDSYAKIIGNEIYGFWKGIGAHGASTLEAYNNIVREQCGWGMSNSSTAKIVAKNNLIYNNGRTGVMIGAINDETVFSNNIIMNNGYGVYVSGDCTDNTWFDAGVAFNYENIIFSYNNVYGNKNKYVKPVSLCNEFTVMNYTGTGNISVDPLFQNAASNDFRIDCGSPAVDMGNPETSDNDINGTRNDMGIYGGPYSQAEPPSCAPSNHSNIKISADKNITLAPNPFTEEVRFNYFVREASDVKIDIVNLNGKIILTLVQEMQNEGTHQVIWKGNDHLGFNVEQGMYFYSIKIGDKSYKGKIIKVD
jgi:hypothetical protein